MSQKLDIWQNRLRRVSGLRLKTPEWVRIHQGGVPFYGLNSWNAECRITMLVEQTEPDWVVLTGIEDQLFLLAENRYRWRKTRLIGFSHQPQSWWQLNHSHPEVVQSLDLLIVLSSQAKQFWDTQFNPERVLFIAHGVDTDFFKPAAERAVPISQDQPLRVVFGGQWMRDFETLGAVVTAVDELGLPIQFDLIVPKSRHDSDACSRMAKCSKVFWHSEVPDEELRNIYQQADLLLLTLVDGTANNSLLEAMACGLPVIVTDVGGVRDYTRTEFADYVRPGYVTDIVDLLRKYLDQKRELMARGALARAYAVDNLSWRVIADQLLTCLEHAPQHAPQ